MVSGIPSADMWGYVEVEMVDAGGAVDVEWWWDPVESVVVDVRRVEGGWRVFACDLEGRWLCRFAPGC
jgi:hypothetical protein